MGYDTDFSGRFELNKKLDKETHEFLVKFNQTRRMARNLPSQFGVEGEFFVDGGGLNGQERDKTIIDFNSPPKTQPGLWCQWVPNGDGTHIEYDGGEKFYAYIEWIEYLIKSILAPKGYSLDGVVEWKGEGFNDLGQIIIKNNKVTVKDLKF